MRKLIFLKKEILEIIKTPKIIIMPAILLFFGLTSPLLAKYTPDILKMYSGSLGEGVTIVIPPATFRDSYIQFFKNISQIGIIVVILAFMSTVVEEKIKGSAVLVLTKSVSRLQFIVSKYTAGVVLFTFAYLVSSAACLYYTWLLFGTIYMENLFAAFAAFWIYGITVLSVTLLASTIARTHTMSAVMAFVGFALLSALTFIPNIGEEIPGALGNISINLVSGKSQLQDMLVPSFSSAATILLMIAASIVIFKKQEI